MIMLRERKKKSLGGTSAPFFWRPVKRRISQDGTQREKKAIWSAFKMSRARGGNGGGERGGGGATTEKMIQDR